MAQPKVVLKAAETLGGAPMERNPGVRDRKLVYPETGFPTRSLIMGIVEVEPGCRAPAHRHNCEEVYYVLDGRGEVVSDGVPHAGVAFHRRAAERLRRLQYDLRLRHRPSPAASTIRSC